MPPECPEVRKVADFRRDRTGEIAAAELDLEGFDPVVLFVAMGAAPVDAAVGVRVPSGEDMRVVEAFLDLEKSFLVLGMAELGETWIDEAAEKN